jgi:hypothetical protein
MKTYGRRDRVLIDTKSDSNVSYTNYNVVQPTVVSGVLTDYVSTDINFERVQDVVNKDFQLRSSRGEIFNNPYYSIKKSVVHGSGNRTAVFKTNSGVVGTQFGDITGRYWYKAGYSFPPNPPTEFLTQWDTSKRNAIVKALSNIDSSDFAFGEDLLEIGKSVQLMRRPFESILEITRNMRKDFKKRTNGKVRASTKMLARASSDSWLKYQFVYGTTVRSLMNLHDAMENRPVPPPLRRTARAFYSALTYDDETTVVTLGTNANRTFRTTKANTLSGRVTIIYEGTSNTTSWQRHYGLRAKDVPVTMWAVAPYSWVIDRFLNISDSLAAITNLMDPKIEILASCTSEQRIVKNTVILVSETDPNWTITLDGNRITEETSLKTRTPFVPSFTDAVPRFENHATDSISSIADLSALATGKLLRVFK